MSTGHGFCHGSTELDVLTVQLQILPESQGLVPPGQAAICHTAVNRLIDVDDVATRKKPFDTSRLCPKGTVI